MSLSFFKKKKGIALFKKKSSTCHDELIYTRFLRIPHENECIDTLAGLIRFNTFSGI